MQCGTSVIPEGKYSDDDSEVDELEVAPNLPKAVVFGEVVDGELLASVDASALHQHWRLTCHFLQ